MTASANSNGVASRASQLIRQRLIRPLLRSRHAPEYTARGVLVGLAIALTPTVGVQMLLVFGVWLLAGRFVRRWDFNLVVAMAWCWVTNIATAPPLYYLYIITGRALLGQWGGIEGYDSFVTTLGASMPRDAGWLTEAWVFLLNLFKAFGVPLFVGCIPWAILGAWAGYVWSLRLLERFARLRERRRTARRQKRQGLAEL